MSDSPPRILVVDDEELNRDLLEAVLTPEGFHVLHACDGPSALQRVRDDKPDLVLLDVLMPGMDGVEVCKKLREEHRSTELPIVFVTAFHDRAARLRGKAAGADDFMTKPIDDVELKIRVHGLLTIKAFHAMQAKQHLLLQEELERTREQLLRADRLATLGTLAAGVGHELNNMALVLGITLSFLQESATSGVVSSDEDLKSLAAVDRHLRAHAGQLLSLGRPSPKRSERLDLAAAIRDSVDMVRLTGRARSARLEVITPDDPVHVVADRTQLEQLVMNLVYNAADATADLAERSPRIVLHLRVSTAGRAVCQVADNGRGIAPAILTRVFEPYFSTKGPSKGTGLGLTVVKQIVDGLRGSLSVRSAVDEGTSFTFELPLADAMGAAAGGVPGRDESPAKPTARTEGMNG